MVEWFAADPLVVSRGRLQFAIDGRDIDLRSIADADPGFVAWL